MGFFFAAFLALGLAASALASHDEVYINVMGNLQYSNLPGGKTAEALRRGRMPLGLGDVSYEATEP